MGHGRYIVLVLMSVIMSHTAAFLCFVFCFSLCLCLYAASTDQVHYRHKLYLLFVKLMEVGQIGVSGGSVTTCVAGLW